MKIKSSYKVGKKVKVTHLGLNYPGRLVAIIENFNDCFSFRIEYSENGSIRSGEFRGDEFEVLDA